VPAAAVRIAIRWTWHTASLAFGLARGNAPDAHDLNPKNFGFPSTASYWPAEDRNEAEQDSIEPRCSNGKVLPDGKAKETQGAG
jgi:hypothetical protein